MFAERVHRLWAECGAGAMRLDSDMLHVDELPVLEIGEDRGRWILPAFMSGLRTLQPRREVTSEDWFDLALRLGRLEISSESLSSFQNWLWSDGAEGFEVTLDASFVETADVIATSVDRDFSAVRTEALFAVDGDTAVVASSDLDAAVLLPEMQVPIESFVDAVEGRALEVSGGTLRGLSEASESVGAWASAEIQVVLASPVLQKGYPAARLARRLASMIAARCDASMLRLLVMLGGNAKGYLQDVWTYLADAGIGATIATGCKVEDPITAAALLDAAARFPDAVATELCRGLLAREGDPAVRVLSDLCERLGGLRFIARGVDDRAGETEGRQLAHVVIRLGLRGRDVDAILARLPTPAALAFVETTGAASLPGDVVARFADSGEHARVIQIAARVRSRDLAQRLLDRIVRDRGARWAEENVLALGVLARDLGLGDRVVEVIRSHRIAAETRLALLHAIEAAPDLEVRATRWSPALLLAPRDVRSAFAESRARRRTRS